MSALRTMPIMAMRIITMIGGKRLRTDERGDVLVGFILIVGLLFGLFFAGVGFFLMFSWLQFAEMASQAGVRTAVVRDAAIEGLPTVIPTNNNLFGQSCSNASNPCGSVGTSTCTGGSCTGAGFPHILASMRQVFPVIQAQNIRITYEDIRIPYPGSALGYASGPPVWLVTVEVVGLPIPVIGPIIDLAFGLLGGQGGANTTMRTIAASMTAEDLNTAGSP
jgi:hypothetical protein